MVSGNLHYGYAFTGVLGMTNNPDLSGTDWRREKSAKIQTESDSCGKLKVSGIWTASPHQFLEEFNLYKRKKY